MLAQRVAFLLLLVLFMAAASAPLIAQAQGNICYNANNACPTEQSIGQPCFCVASIQPVYVVKGFCAAVHYCHAVSYTGLGGSSSGVDSGLAQLGQVLGQLMQQLMKGQSGGGSGGSAPPTGSAPLTPTPTSGCQSNYFQTSDISRLSDPCAQYVPPTTDTGSGTDSCDPLSAALGNCSASSTSNSDTSSASDPWATSFTGGGASSSDANVASSSRASSTRTVIYPTIPSAPVAPGKDNVSLTPGVRGDVQLLNGGATIVVGSRSATSNSEVAGFYGQSTVGQPQGLVATWCTDRPWASNFLANIIAPSFFDGLCEWRGYQVGAPQVSAAPSAPAPIPTVQNQSAPPPAPVAPITNAKADIWAVPASVNLGARTSIFWSSQNVENCKETSPDGNFNQGSLSGGAATVPLTSATTFTIDCVAADGSHVTDSFTVQMGL